MSYTITSVHSVCRKTRIDLRLVKATVTHDVLSFQYHFELMNNKIFEALKFFEVIILSENQTVPPLGSGGHFRLDPKTFGLVTR